MFFLAYHPAEYRGVIPPPLPPVLDLLPKERRVQKKLTRIDKEGSKNAAIDEIRRYKRGFLGTMESIFQQAGFQVEKGYNMASTKMVDAFQNWDYEKSTKYFREKFHALPGETLWDRGYLCSMVSGQMGVPCVVFVTTNYICFQGWTKTREEIQAVIPLKSIVSIQKAISLRHTQQTYAPSIRLPENPSLRCDALQIYTNEGYVHQLFGFVKERHMSDLLNIMDHAWRAVLSSSSSVIFLNPVAKPGPINTVQTTGLNPIVAPLSNLPPEPFRPQVITNPYQGASVSTLQPYPVVQTTQAMGAVPFNTPSPSLYSSTASVGGGAGGVAGVPPPSMAPSMASSSPSSTLYSSTPSTAPMLPTAHPIINAPVARFAPATLMPVQQAQDSPRLPMAYPDASSASLSPAQQQQQQMQFAQPQRLNPYDASKA